MSKCLHVPLEYAHRCAPVACHECLAFVDRDGSLMTATLARQLYPTQSALIDQYEASYQPIREPLEPPDLSIAQIIDQLTSSVFQLAWNLFLVVICLLVLAALLIFLFQ